MAHPLTVSSEFPLNRLLAVQRPGLGVAPLFLEVRTETPDRVGTRLIAFSLFHVYSKNDLVHRSRPTSSGFYSTCSPSTAKRSVSP